jgi:hypothetical protein
MMQPAGHLRYSVTCTKCGTAEDHVITAEQLSAAMRGDSYAGLSDRTRESIQLRLCLHHVDKRREALVRGKDIPPMSRTLRLAAGDVELILEALGALSTLTPPDSPEERRILRLAESVSAQTGIESKWRVL